VTISELPPRRLTAQCEQPTPLLGISVLTVVEPNVDFEVDQEDAVAIRMGIHPPSNYQLSPVVLYVAPRYRRVPSGPSSCYRPGKTKAMPKSLHYHSDMKGFGFGGYSITAITQAFAPRATLKLPSA
jgi:hypothetical protein